MTVLLPPPCPADMADFIVPPYSRREVIEAGKALRGQIRDDPVSIERAIEVFKIAHEWRSAHQVPMRHIRAGIAANMQQYKLAGLTAARLKRMASIRGKLAKGRTSLLDMRDIGGCRAIVAKPSDVTELCALLHERNSECRSPRC